MSAAAILRLHFARVAERHAERAVEAMEAGNIVQWQRSLAGYRDACRRVRAIRVNASRDASATVEADSRAAARRECRAFTGGRALAAASPGRSRAGTGGAL